MYRAVFLRCLEMAGFLLPAFLPTRTLRLVVLGVYFAAHVGGAPAAYARYKRS